MTCFQSKVVYQMPDPALLLPQSKMPEIIFQEAIDIGIHGSAWESICYIWSLASFFWSEAVV